MLDEDNINLLLSRARYPDSLNLQMEVFQAHLRKTESVLQSLAKTSSPEVDSYLLVRKLIKIKIEQLENQIRQLQEDG